ncbi:MAG: hypothetical protein FD160_3253 [Caulobacteraceae bacterium]|nr:MAG: hypothetical protein FD160_3253 [Caulobacteraceae bacterium]
MTLMIGQCFGQVSAAKRRGIYIVDVHPDVESRRVPHSISGRAVRWNNEFDPLLVERTGQRLAEVHRRMRLLAHAELVITRRLHVALPCVGFGTPVLTLPNPGISDARHRFSGYEEFLPILWPEDEPGKFDFENPSISAVSAELENAYAKLVQALGFSPPVRSWDDSFEVSRSLPAGIDPGVAFGLRLGIDVVGCPPAERVESGFSAILPVLPFADRLNGEFEAMPPEPSSVAEALESYPVRRVVELIGAHLAGEVSLAKLDVLMRQLAQGALFESVMLVWMPALRSGRQSELEADWRRAAVQFGVDAYETGRLVDVVWRAGDFDAARALITEMRDVLEHQKFSKFGDEYHRERNVEILDGFEAIIGYESGALILEDGRLSNLHAFLLGAVSGAIAFAVESGNSSRSCRLAELRIFMGRQAGLEPDEALRIAEGVLVPIGAASAAIQYWTELRAQMLSLGIRWRVLRLVGVAALETGDSSLLEDVLSEVRSLLNGFSVEALLSDKQWADAYVWAVRRLSLTDDEVTRSELAHLRPHLHDERAKNLALRISGAEA